MDMRVTDTRQLRVKALFHCAVSVSILLLDSGDSSHSQCWERRFFPWMTDRHSPKSLKGAKHTIQWTAINTEANKSLLQLFYFPARNFSVQM